MEDTIVAISSALGEGAISIIRMSGKDSIKIISSIFSKNLRDVKSHTINYGYIIDNKEVIDEVLVTIMKAPKTYTKEDIIEINSHGSVATVNRILELLLNKGARRAEPGEFTKRAFLNGRIDLIQAEGVMDLINSETEEARKSAVNEMTGEVTKMIEKIRKKILELLSNIEVNIDYPEYEDIEIVTRKKIEEEMKDINENISKIIEKSENKKIIKEGIKVAIIGNPNVGKSSLLNVLIGEEKAIVTKKAGTTRDIVEGKILINGIIFSLYDTAGIRKTKDIVEKKGVIKSKEKLKEADLIILVLDSSKKLSKEDIKLIEETKNKKRIIVYNKKDKEQKVKSTDQDIYLSTKTKEGINELKEKMSNMFILGNFKNKDYTYLCTARQLNLLKEAQKITEEILNTISKNIEIDMIELDIKQVLEKLDEIIGKSYKEELINELFSKFCVGK